MRGVHAKACEKQMDILIAVVLLVLGFVMLIKGADWFVDGAAGIAARFGIPQLVIGLTIVAMGTSAPEAAVSINAALTNNAGITIGNVLGSNILNVLVILGVTAVITTVAVSEIKFSSSQLLFIFENAIASFRIKCHCQLHKNDIILIFKGENMERITEFIFHLENHMNLYSSGKFYIGIGSKVKLDSLAKSFFHSSAAILMAKTLDKKHISYEELGFYRILFSSTDKGSFEKFIDEQLGKIILYDEKHNSNYLLTLRSYLFNGGSLKAMTEELFCHRNTINYRVNVLKETFNLELDDAICRFHLMAAFYIRDFLGIINTK